MEVYTESQKELDPQQDDVHISSEDRRLLLGASIRLLSRRFSCGKPILQDDLLRVAALADDVERAA